MADMSRGPHAGDPGCNDAVLEATWGQPASRVDEHGLGWLFFMPMVTFSGESIALAHSLLAKIHEEAGVRAGGNGPDLGACGARRQR
ncbi:hypothetical protein ABT237_01895 [Streptomyces sp. NPDC001581]|uniref:hypothetical protein n=1 Tax=Streptomyces sp. NPDC001581 TaxID=3154386 RepID=UPI0033177DF8